MRLTDDMRAFVKTHYYEIDGEQIASGHMGMWDALIARNIAGHQVFPDYTPIGPHDTVASNPWWRENAEGAQSQKYNQLNRAATHLLWLTARYHRRFGSAP
jgi:hypothetical protein